MTHNRTGRARAFAAAVCAAASIALPPSHLFADAGAGQAVPHADPHTVYERDEAPRLPVLVYHQIRGRDDATADGMTVISLSRFTSQMAYLHDQGYATLSMDDTVAFLKGGTFPPRIVALHFDDGWQSAARALPVLERYGFKATFWIIGTEPGSGELFMDWQALMDLEKNPNYRVQSHTMSHPFADGDSLLDWEAGRTPGRSGTDVTHEIADSRTMLEKKLGHPVPYLAWPAGVFDDALIRRAQQAGYTALVTTDDGANHPGGDPLQIHRIVVNGACDDDVFPLLLADGRYRQCP